MATEHIVADELFIVLAWQLRRSTGTEWATRTGYADNAITSRFIELRWREHVHTNET